jgi:hypothetical protein
VEAQAHQAEMKQIGLVLDLSPRLPRTDLDAGMIERLVANLLHNAVKFTPENGAIRVSTQRQGTRVGIEVWNSGDHIPAAIRANRRLMVWAPLPFVGLRGIRRLGGSLVKLSRDPRLASDYLPRYLGHIVRMQEEIGTGGGGFRFIYAAFLQEAGRLMGSTGLEAASRMMTESGDMCRRFALACARACKSRTGDFDAAEIARLVQQCAKQEKHVYSYLKSMKL